MLGYHRLSPGSSRWSRGKRGARVLPGAAGGKAPAGPTILRRFLAKLAQKSEGRPANLRGPPPSFVERLSRPWNGHEGNTLRSSTDVGH
jgi:hypothetical protein